jgi:hypothetical protein
MLRRAKSAELWLSSTAEDFANECLPAFLSIASQALSRRSRLCIDDGGRLQYYKSIAA